MAANLPTDPQKSEMLVTAAGKTGSSPSSSDSQSPSERPVITATAIAKVSVPTIPDHWRKPGTISALLPKEIAVLHWLCRMLPDSMRPEFKEVADPVLELVELAARVLPCELKEGPIAKLAELMEQHTARGKRKGPPPG